MGELSLAPPLSTMRELSQSATWINGGASSHPLSFSPALVLGHALHRRTTLCPASRYSFPPATALVCPPLLSLAFCYGIACQLALALALPAPSLYRTITSCRPVCLSPTISPGHALSPNRALSPSHARLPAWIVGRLLAIISRSCSFVSSILVYQSIAIK